MQKPKKASFFLVVTIALLITGNLIGAGIMGLPINTGIEGFIPALIVMLVFGGAMFFSAVVLGKEAAEAKTDTFNYPSLYQEYLGNVGKWAAIIANMVILYGLLTAYLAGGTTIIAQILHIKGSSNWILLILFAILTTLSITGTAIIRKYNIILMLLLWTSFGVIVFIGEEHSEVQRLTYTDWTIFPISIPIIITSFHFHNIIPSVAKNLKWNIKTITITMLIGMIIGYIMNAIWIQVGVGAIPLEGGPNSIIYAFHHNYPSTVPMVNIIHSPVFTTCTMLFALLAIATSYIANGLGLVGFNRDLMINICHKHTRWAIIALSFLPPLVIALLFHDIFLRAIDIVGGLGIVILFGILPSIISIIKSPHRKWWRFLSYIMLIVFSLVLLLKIAEEADLIKLTPKVEQYKKL